MADVRSFGLSIVIPVHSKGRRLPDTLRQWSEFQLGGPWDWEICSADDSSVDERGPYA
jgi:hypothetical protein